MVSPLARLFWSPSGKPHFSRQNFSQPGGYLSRCSFGVCLEFDVSCQVFSLSPADSGTAREMELSCPEVEFVSAVFWREDSRARRLWREPKLSVDSSPLNHAAALPLTLAVAPLALSL